MSSSEKRLIRRIQIKLADSPLSRVPSGPESCEIFLDDARQFQMTHSLHSQSDPVPPPVIRAERLGTNPLIDFNSHPSLGNNINGPSLIKVPGWVENPLGKYYLYFGHHGGQYIRLAFANQVEGPWHIYEPGVIPLESAPVLYGHLASPDVHIDLQNRELFMFLHGPVKNGVKKQMTLLARSRDGINWDVGNQKLGQSYFRVFPHRDGWYAVANCGDFYRTKDISMPWEKHEKAILPHGGRVDRFGKPIDDSLRHSAMFVEQDSLYLFYTRKADRPERILCVRIELTDDWNTWRFSEPVEVLRPEKDWEGIHCELTPSKAGPATGVQQLRDPAIYREGKRIFMVYSFAGEEGLALAELFIRGVNG